MRVPTPPRRSRDLSKIKFFLFYRVHIYNFIFYECFETRVLLVLVSGVSFGSNQRPVVGKDTVTSLPR